jgi:hypothetical protein
MENQERVRFPRSQHLRAVEEAAEKFHKQAAALDELRQRLYEAIVDAHDEGISNAKIAQAAGFSRENVRQVVLAARKGH